MQYRPLGATGLTVSAVGFGAWGIGGAIGGAAYGRTDDAASLRALRRALELGVTFYDTSDLYGAGHSEALLGEAFAGVRDRVVIATKAGFRPDGGQDYAPAYLRAALEASLRRLRTDYVDLFMLHSPPAGLFDAEPAALAGLQALQAEGKIRAYGVSTRAPADGLAAARHGVTALQANFSMADQRAREAGLLDPARAPGLGLIARTPLCFGFLTGRVDAASRFAPDDHRSGWSAEQIGLWAAAHRRFAAALDAPGQTAAQLALRYCLSYDAVATAIPGMLTAEQVEENAAAADLGPLPPEQVAAIERLYREIELVAAKPRR